MEENIVETVETQNPQEEVVQEQKGVNHAEVLRQLSKKFSVNLFDETGLKTLDDKLNEQATKNQKIIEDNKVLNDKIKLFETKEQDYNFKIEALGEGFKIDTLDEVLALTKVGQKENETIKDALKRVKEKFGSVLITTQDIGIVHNDLKGDNPDLGKSEAEKYMSQDPKYRNYYKKK